MPLARTPPGGRLRLIPGPPTVTTEILIGLVLLGCGAPSAPDARLRELMVRDQIEARGIRDPLTLGALRKVPRQLFVRTVTIEEAYEDTALPIDQGQTISQPYVVAAMTAALRLRGGEKVLEIGTGSGYQAALLAEIVGHIYTIEILPTLAAEARDRLTKLGYKNVSTKTGDGYRGWPEFAPFDGILVTAAAPWVPTPLKEQLAEGGRLVIPVGDAFQELVVITKKGFAYEETHLFPVRFVPMTGEIKK